VPIDSGKPWANSPTTHGRLANCITIARLAGCANARNTLSVLCGLAIFCILAKMRIYVKGSSLILAIFFSLA
jgi:hypothetical protein